jgi:hypothetical protein
MRTVLCILFAIFASCANADDVFGNLGGCARAAGAAERDDTAVIFDQTVLEFHESFCTIIKTTKIGPNVQRFETECQGEGASWPLSFIVETLPEEDAILLADFDAPDTKTKLKRCD